MKTHVLIVSRHFQATHSKKGEPTYFNFKIINGIKIHTIRGNYPYWKQRIQDVIDGKAVLSVRQWTGKPYNSRQKEILKFTSADPIGVQKLTVDPYMGWFIDDVDSKVKGADLAENDGLKWEDFKEWFTAVKPGQEMVIIHFTKFRY